MRPEVDRQIRAAVARGDWQSVRDVSKRALKAVPGDVQVKAILARSESHLGNHEAAVSLCRELTGAQPKNPEFWMALCMAEKAKGDVDAAELSARKVIELRPRDPLAWNTVGLCCLHQNRGEEALAAFERALEIQPEVGALHRHRGMVLVRLSRHAEAYASFEKALQIDPRDFQSWLQMASLHLRHDRNEDTVECAQHALRLRPEHPEALFYLARAKAHLGQKAEADDLFRRATKGENRYINTHAVWCIEEGRLDEASELLKQRLAVDPHDGVALYYLIESLKAPASIEQVGQLQACLEDSSQSTDSHAFASYALAKVAEKAGDFEGSMGYYNRANSTFFGTKLRHVKDLVGTIDDEVETARYTFTKPRLDDLRRSHGIKDTRPIFIIGMIRTGTTLLEQIVSAHSEVEAAGELRYWMERGPHVLSDLSQLHACGQGYLAHISHLHPHASRVTDKMPLNLRFLGLIAAAFPNAKFLWTQRDPMDTCFSVYSTPFMDPPIFSFNLRNIGHVYRRYHDLMQHWISVLPEGSVLPVQYEDLVADQERVTREVLEFLNLPFEEACLHPEANRNAVRTPSSMQVRKPVYRTSVQRWKNFEPWLDDLKAGLGPLAPP